MAKSEAANIRFLKGTAGIRKRPSMYIGSTDSRGRTHLVGEAINNSVDQFLMGHADSIKIKIDDDACGATVSDDGAGFPFDVIPEGCDVPLGTQYLTTIHHSATADDHVPHVHFLHRDRFHGIGIVSLNALSESFVCRAWRNGSRWSQSFRQGFPVSPAAVIERGKGCGTEIQFRLDPKVFNDPTIDRDALQQQVQERVYLFAGLSIQLDDATLKADQGLASLAVSMTADLQPKSVVQRPAFYMNETYDDMIIHAAACGDADATEWRAWVNSITMPKGGTHQIAFRDAMEEFSWTPAVGLVHVMMKDPQYTGGTIERLDVPRFYEPIRLRIREQLIRYCEQWGIERAVRTHTESITVSDVQAPSSLSS